MALSAIVWNPPARTLRQFAGLWLVFFGAVAWRAGLPEMREGVPLLLAALAVTVGSLGLLVPRAMRPVFVGWMIVVYPIGWVVSRLLLALVFFGLFTPLGLLFRLAGRDALHLCRVSPASYWQPRPSRGNVRTYFHPY